MLDPSILAIGQEFTCKKDLFTYPVASSFFHIFLVQKLGPLKARRKVDRIKCKGVKLPLQTKHLNSYAVFPLLMPPHVA